MKNKLLHISAAASAAAMLLSFAMCASACARETYRVGGESSADGTKGTDVVLCGTSADTEPSGSDGADSAPPEKTPYPIPISNDMLDLDVKAPQCYVYSVNTGTMLYLKGRGEILYPASTTKLLTIMYALTLLSPDELVTPGDELSLVGEFSTIAYVRPNHTLTVEMLIEGMLLPSGNDAAYVLAAAAGRKLTDDKTVNGVEAVGFFVEGMNSYAKTLGMTGSHFTSPTATTTTSIIRRSRIWRSSARSRSKIPSSQNTPRCRRITSSMRAVILTTGKIRICSSRRAVRIIRRM